MKASWQGDSAWSADEDVVRNATIIGFCLLLAACGSGKQRDTTVRRPEVPATDASAPRISWPENAPPYAQAYPNGAVTTSFSGSDAGAAGTMVMFVTPDRPEQVIDFYQSLARRAGLLESSTVASGNARMFSASDSMRQRSLIVQATRDTGETQGVVTFGGERR